MNAIIITAAGGPDVLQIQSRPDPSIGEYQVLIQVKAAGINRPDVLQRKGYYPAPPGAPADIPGLEVSGVIVALGSAVKRWEIGDEVCALVPGGGYAELVAADADVCLPIPTGLSFAEAAALPETIYTVYDNVFRRGGLKQGEHLLVHGGSGGIGSTAIQLAKASGAVVSTTAGSADKCAYCKRLGADIVIDYKKDDFVAVLKDQKVNVILDSIGGDYFEKNIDILAPDGRLVYINAVQGKQVAVDLMRVMQKRIVITGSTLRARDVTFKAQLTREIGAFVWPLIGDLFKPQVYKEFELADAAKAHACMEDGNFFGKLVLTI
ncbi:NAD(P)H-quinone oxidoreductase [Sphingobacterium paludis]|uniref:Putative PIG3 family NAD(P)H quinone oxidoreductase n=1 Tax=Sphingobacterium paludis TaxID=1476465 RepID=A0A4R7CSV4_9SPHI|nr:NAD(P)H-quinone oxidoreductase [Sphingobacterium paludis]TDS07496.1 putative PIG3 family NAD(P)H quinone oxidoreductase [Sphingobacterium paludis]